MMKIRQKIMPFLTVFFVAALAVIPCFHPPVTAMAGEDVLDLVESEGVGEGLVIDHADLLTDGEEESLEEKLGEISARQSFDIVILTEQSIGGQSAESYADDYYDYHGYGQGSGHDGCLLLVDMGTRAYHTSTTGFGIEALTDYGMQRMDDAFVPYLSDGEFYDAFNAYANVVDELVTRAKEGEAYDVGTASHQDDPIEAAKDRSAPGAAAAAGAGGIGAAAAAISTGRMKSKLKSVRTQHGASQYYEKNSMNVRVAREDFLYRNVTRTEIPRDNDRGSGGSSVHIGSSGVSHGGHGGHF